MRAPELLQTGDATIEFAIKCVAPFGDERQARQGLPQMIAGQRIATEILGLPRKQREALIARHGEIFTVAWWHDMQHKLNAGHFFDISRYREEVRLKRD